MRNNKTQKIITSSGNAIHGPETIVFGNDGTMYVLSEDAYLVKVEPFDETPDGWYINSTATVVADLGMGRPLGGKFTPKGNTLYICDSILGLTRIRDVKDVRKSKLEIVTRTAIDHNGTVTPIEYADDVVIGPKTGKVYFTDATDIAPQRKYTFDTWDALFASKLDLIRGKAAGRLLQYDPNTDRTTILATDLKFPNGIGIDKDETYLVFAETFGVNLWKYHLGNGTMELLIGSQDLPGYLDGVDCSWTTGLCYAVMPSAIVPLHHFLNYVPMQVSQALRNIILLLPKWLAPSVKKFGGMVEVNPNTKEYRLLLDPTGKDISMITGVTVYKNKLYLGSLSNKYIGVYNL
jgi:sugar lactone lactonase YvrE